MTWTRLLLLPPLLSAALVGASGTAADADDTGHDHSAMTMETGTTDPHDHDSMEHRTLDMDYSTGAEHTHEHGTETSTDTHEHGTAPPKDRPLGLVLGAFGGVNGVVVLGAALVRRRERTSPQSTSCPRSRAGAT